MELVNQICNTLSLNSHRYFNNEILTQSTQSRNNNKLIKTKTKKNQGKGLEMTVVVKNMRI